MNVSPISVPPYFPSTPPYSHSHVFFTRWLHFSFIKLLPFRCFYPNADYVDIIQIVTLVPIGLVFVMVITFYIRHVFSLLCTFSFYSGDEKARQSFIDSEKVAANRIKARYFSLFLMMSYIVLPGVSTTIVDAILCRNVDPDDVVPGDNHVLK